MVCYAAARIVGGEASSPLCGQVKFTAQPDGVLIEAQICGLPESQTGFYGFHIHTGSDCCGEGFPNTQGHYNPADTPHPQHAGDLPPLLGCGGKAYLAVKTNRFCLSEIIGKTVVIHSHPDDFRTQPSGDSGSKIGCGVIKGA